MADEINNKNNGAKKLPIDVTAPVDDVTEQVFGGDTFKDDAVADDKSSEDKLSENTISDVTIENEDGEGNMINSVSKIKDLREKLKKCEAERMEYLSGWQRAKADLINARKRDEDDKKEFTKYANEDLIGEILTVLDSFDMAFANKEAWEKVDKNWRMGVEYIYSQLVSTLERYGMKVINPLGQKFDPKHHISVENVPVVDKAQDGIIIDVIQKGYDLGGKVIRAPKVKVGELKS